jgi:hypothetical protein
VEQLPLHIGEITIGGHLNPLNAQTSYGRTHIVSDLEGVERLAIDPASNLGKHIMESGFEV